MSEALNWFIAESQRHFGINSAFIGDDDLSFALRLAFRDMGETELDFFPFGGNQDGEVFDVLG